MATEQGRRYAEIALKSMLDNGSLQSYTASELAEYAWDISDEMMKQEKYRE